jgi:hypothetical protein
VELEVVQAISEGTVRRTRLPWPEDTVFRSLVLEVESDSCELCGASPPGAPASRLREKGKFSVRRCHGRPRCYNKKDHLVSQADPVTVDPALLATAVLLVSLPVLATAGGDKDEMVDNPSECRRRV